MPAEKERSSAAGQAARAAAKVVLIYNADSGALEAMLDGMRKLARRADACALCAVTHGILWRKKDWKETECSLGLPIVYYHRDEILGEAANFLRANGLRLPVVAFEMADGSYETAVTSAEIAECRGDPKHLRARIEAARERLDSP